MRRGIARALFVIAAGLGLGASDDATVSERQERVREYHGAAGPWAVAGYRIGERALAELGLPRHSVSLLVVYHCPARVRFACIADGLQAATGASPGKLNLRVEEATEDAMRTVIRDRVTGRSLTFTLKPGFFRSLRDLPSGRIEAEGRRVAELPYDNIFVVKSSTP